MIVPSYSTGGAWRPLSRGACPPPCRNVTDPHRPRLSPSVQASMERICIEGLPLSLQRMLTACAVLSAARPRVALRRLLDCQAKAVAEILKRGGALVTEHTSGADGNCCPLSNFKAVTHDGYVFSIMKFLILSGFLAARSTPRLGPAKSVGGGPPSRRASSS